MAANPDKGEVDLVINGTTYTLTLKTAALMALQQHFSTPVDVVEKAADGSVALVTKGVADLDVIMARVAAGSIEHVVALLWASMQKFHPDVTFQKAVSLIDDLGGIEALSDAFAEIQKSTVPDPRDTKELEDGKAKSDRPRKARATHGTGESGISKLAASA